MNIITTTAEVKKPRKAVTASVPKLWQKQEQELVLTAAEKRIILAYRNMCDEVQEATVRTTEAWARSPLLTRPKAPTFRLIAGGRAS